LQPFQRAAASSVLARHLFPAWPDFALRYTGAVEAADVEEVLETFLTSLYPNKPLEVFDLLARLGALGVTGVSGPLEVAFLLYDKSRKITMVRSKNVATLPKGAHMMGELDHVVVTRGG
jgi:hypothetical protein